MDFCFFIPGPGIQVEVYMYMYKCQCCIRGRLSRDEAETETWLSETEMRPRHRHCETETWLSETETRPRPLKNFTLFFSTCWICFDHFGVFIQWTLVITNSLGPSEITLLYQNFVISGLQNNKIQRNFELWDQENYFVISDFVISVFFITRVHCIYTLPLPRSGRDIET